MRPAVAWLRTALLVAVSFAIALYFVVAFGQQAWRARQLEAQVAERQRALAELVAERDRLAQELAALDGDRYRAYVERTARRELNLTYPGETVLFVEWQEGPTVSEPSAVAAAREPVPNWARWLQQLRLPVPGAD
ncbi:MAG: septum formation initiator family protein [Thermomicrobium sp.]|nr:septum formation initiator family protein [Thermomicrobium sp.]MDW8059897.1 septum formation initiator family protein [Thermomicrobium sp.]